MHLVCLCVFQQLCCYLQPSTYVLTTNKIIIYKKVLTKVSFYERDENCKRQHFAGVNVHCRRGLCTKYLYASTVFFCIIILYFRCIIFFSRDEYKRQQHGRNYLRFGRFSTKKKNDFDRNLTVIRQ